MLARSSCGGSEPAMIESDQKELTLRVDRVVVAAGALAVIFLSLYVLAPLWAP